MNTCVYLDDCLTVHHSITLVYLQLDAQNSYLFTYNTFIKILYMFRALPCSSSGGQRRNCIYEGDLKRNAHVWQHCVNNDAICPAISAVAQENFWNMICASGS